MLAIWRIGGSTKSKDDGKGQIGERGIGFKSVFRVASEVFVTSRGYSFKFAKHEKLRMVTPRRAIFLGAHELDTTQIYLKLEDRSDDHGDVYETVYSQLSGIDGGLLLFLRKIKAMAIASCNLFGSGSRTRSLMCARPSIYDKGGRRLLDGDECTDILMVRHTANDMPVQENRSSCRSIELVLAFPITADEPIARNRHVHAFLPIGKYGFNISTLGQTAKE